MRDVRRIGLLGVLVLASCGASESRDESSAAAPVTAGSQLSAPPASLAGRFDRPATCAPSPSLSWAQSFADRGEPTQFATNAAGDVYVLLREAHADASFLASCPAVAQESSGDVGLFLARYTSAGDCLWSRWMGNPMGPLADRALAATEDGAVVLRENHALLVRADGSQGATPSPALPDANAYHAAASHGVAVVMSAEPSALHLSRISMEGAMSTTTIPLEGPVSGLAVAERLGATVRKSGSVVLFGYTSYPIASLGIPAPPAGLASDIAVELDANGAVSWSKVLGHTHPLAIRKPAVETADGTLWFWGDNDLQASDGLWRGVGTYVATRGSDGSWAATTYPDLKIDAAAPLLKGGLVVLGTGSVTLDGKTVTPSAGADQMILELGSCSSVRSFGDATRASHVSSLTPLGSGFLVAGTFGGPDGACSEGTLVTDAGTLSTSCRGVFGMAFSQ